jgi:hypothetical protein
METDQPSTQSQPRPIAPAPTASALVAACEDAWRTIQHHHPAVPDVVIVLGTGVERGRLVKLGHWWDARWIADGKPRGEVLLAGEALHLPAEAVLDVLLHEAAHGFNAARGVKDSSRGGRYHNARFRTTAQELGLLAEQVPPYGWAQTSIGPEAQERYRDEIARISDATRIARRLAADVRIGSDAEVGDPNRLQTADGQRAQRQEPLTCGCGRRMRMAPSVFAQGPVQCGMCGQPFSSGRTLVKESSLHDARALTRTQREGLTVLVELGTTEAGVRLLTETGAWYAARRAGEELPLLGTSVASVRAANQVARAMLKLDGSLRRPGVSVRGREMMLGEFVVVGESDGRLLDADGVDLPPAGVFGVVERTQRDEMTIDFAITGRRRIAIESAAAAAIEYGYAETANIASSFVVHRELRVVPPQTCAPDIDPTS